MRQKVSSIIKFRVLKIVRLRNQCIILAKFLKPNEKNNYFSFYKLFNFRK